MSNLLKKINPNRIPKHIAVVMDGNGRWAKKHGYLRAIGHKSGVKAVREIVQASDDIGVKYLTLYTFSTENWNRPKLEVNALMELMIDSLTKELDGFQKNNVKIRTIGDLSLLPSRCKKKFADVVEKTSKNTGLNLIFALSYSSRLEIISAVKSITTKVLNKEIKLEDIDSDVIDKHLYTNSIPDPDLLIRTSGEQRISNFLLWQVAYSELHFTPVLWPDFKQADLFTAVIDYQQRERRFGKTSEQIKK
jgi:undecaprenyl diphosphate synthase